MQLSLFTYFLLLSAYWGIMAKAPAGTLEVPGMHNVYLDQHEVTNAMWRSYMHYVKTHPEEFEEAAYRRSFPNLELWHQVYPVDFDTPSKYDEYPIVAVNYPQVVNYCLWRSTNISAKRKQDIMYTLPSVFEYGRAARGAKSVASGLYATNMDVPEFMGLCDNASEMTNLEGIALGGYANACMDTVFFFKPQSDLGFRCKAYFK